MATVYIGLVHYPILNKYYEVIATAITNLDIHDISRTAMTYGIKKYFIIHPLTQQQELATQILDYWRDGFGGTYNPDRKQALNSTTVITSIEDAIKEITAAEGQQPIVVTTDAREYPNSVSYQSLRARIETDNQPVLLLFGTGNGIEQSMMASFDYILEPIRSRNDYNHLCVRSAVAIILDRLLGV
ncbi:MAG: RNA methyltransferase [Bacillota bacterium]